LVVQVLLDLLVNQEHLDSKVSKDLQDKKDLVEVQASMVKEELLVYQKALEYKDQGGHQVCQDSKGLLDLLVRQVYKTSKDYKNQENREDQWDPMVNVDRQVS